LTPEPMSKAAKGDDTRGPIGAIVNGRAPPDRTTLPSLSTALAVMRLAAERRAFRRRWRPTQGRLRPPSERAEPAARRVHTRHERAGRRKPAEHGQSAVEAIAKTLPLRSVGYENEKGERQIWLELLLARQLTRSTVLSAQISILDTSADLPSAYFPRRST
jgi:hypothetical protein